MMQMNNNNNNSRFYRTPWSIPSPSQGQQQKKKKKVVSIPVHFVASNSDSSNVETTTNNNKKKNNSAMKIQKVVRGFLVRNSMRKIKAIRLELEKIERKVCDDPESKELMKRVQKERVRVSEGIMNLLLKLDSVRVLDYYSAVRDYRKFVIKKAIALQEMVDQIHLVEDDDDQLNHQEQSQLNQIESEDANAGRTNARDSHLIESAAGEGADANERKIEGLKEEEVEEKKEDGEGEEKKMDGFKEEEEKMEVEEKKKEDGEGEEKKMDSLRNGDEEKIEVEDKEKEKGDEDGDGVGEESVGTSMVEEVEENYMVKEEGEEEEEEVEGCEDGRRGEEGDYDENKKNKELLERMMEDNEKMMGMMAQLFEKNEMQTRLLSSLSQRVEQLERAYACDKMRKKKRRNVDAKHKLGH